ncbi:Uncharacterised protein [Citrobacter koseri]|nr:Uncharacterised protein [Citrobacter koseri]
MFNIALLGAGRIGQVHAANIATHKETTLWSVVDPNETFCLPPGYAISGPSAKS